MLLHVILHHLAPQCLYNTGKLFQSIPPGRHNTDAKVGPRVQEGLVVVVGLRVQECLVVVGHRVQEAHVNKRPF